MRVIAVFLLFFSLSRVWASSYLCHQVFSIKTTPRLILPHEPVLVTDSTSILDLTSHISLQAKDRQLEVFLKRLQSSPADPIDFLVGIEVEGSIPLGLDLPSEIEASGAEVSHFFPESRQPARFYRNSIELELGGRIAQIQFVEDGSLMPGQGFEGKEIVSPILVDPEQLQNYARFVNSLEAYGFLEDPMTGGLHFHIGLRKPTLILAEQEVPRPINKNALALVFKVYSLLDPQIRHQMIIPSPRQRFLQEVPGQQLDGMIQNGVDLELLQASHGKTAEKPALIYSRYGTLEFRVGNSTLDPHRIVQQGLFWQRLVAYTFAKEESWLSYLQTTSAEELTLQGVLSVLGFHESPFLTQPQ